MTYALQAIVGLMSGCLIGLGFFGGLWITVRRLPHARHPAALALASLAARLALACAGFYLVLRLAQVAGVLGAVAGFVIVRIAMTRTLSREQVPS